MDNRRLLLGIALFGGSFLLIWVARITLLLGPLPGFSDLYGGWPGLTPPQRLFLVACLLAGAYGAGVIVDTLVRLLKKK
jgi:hypothetical protein